LPAKGKATIVVIPDTQGYSIRDANVKVLNSVMQWLVNNLDQRNIQCVLHVGDMTNNNSRGQWDRIRQSYGMLDNKVPYIICEGNHDLKKQKGVYTDYLNSFFSINDNACNKPLMKASFEPGKLQNTLYHIKIGEQDFAFLTLEFSPRQKVLDWAISVIKQNGDKHIFLVVHDYLNEHSRLLSYDGQPQVVGKVPGAKRRTTGMDIYEKVVLPNPNVEFLVCGHAGAVRLRQANEPLSPVEERAIQKNSRHGSHKEAFFKTFCYDPDIATGHRTDTVINSLLKHQILFNAQWVKDEDGAGNGGDGWILLMEFDANNEKVQLKTYSPYLNKWRIGSEFNYELKRSVVN